MDQNETFIQLCWGYSDNAYMRTNIILFILILSATQSWGAGPNIDNSQLTKEACQKILKADAPPLPQATNTAEYRDAMQVGEQLAQLKARCQELHPAK